MSSRDLFSELSTGLVEAKAHSEGKLTLKTYKFDDIGELDISPTEISEIRHRFNMSRGVFARILRTSSRTLENWEQGRSTPNGQAITLLKLVKAYPETVEHISKL